MHETSQSPKISFKFYCQIPKKVIDTNVTFSSSILFLTIFFRFQKNERQDIVQRLWKDINQRRQQLSDIEQSLPKPNGTYLKIILGNVNVSILNKEDKCG